MRSIGSASIFLLLLAFINAKRIEILMPNVSTQREDSYMASYFKLDEDDRYITMIEPLTNAKIAHHLFVYGCEKPAQLDKSYWEGADVCRGAKILLFAWGLNAKPLLLPEDVNFKVGPETTINYLVINIHYLNKAINDHSGVAITFTDKKRTYEAGIMILLPLFFQIPPMTKEYSTSLSCKYTGKDIKAFAVRVHAHMHGDVNAAYRVRNNEWTEIAKGDPQLPQAFYPMKQVLDIKNGDILLGMCTYHNNETRIVTPGPTHNDEMCNIYIMFYTENSQEIMGTCVGNAYPALEQKIPADAKIKPIHNEEISTSFNDHQNNHEMSPVPAKTTNAVKPTDWRFDEDHDSPPVYDKRIELRLPNVTTLNEDAYIVSAFKLADDERYITMIEPLTNAKIAHHMFVYGCDEPADTKSYWEGANPCRGQQIMLFAWGLNAKALVLPEDVNFIVGPGTNIKYLVINIHYLNKANNDRSGVAVYFTNKKHTYEAGIMLLIPDNFAIPALTKQYSTSLSCKYTGQPIIGFAVRVHAHAHGDVNAAYRVRNNEWTEIAKGDPQLPQAFYPMKLAMEIKEGDIILGMCTYHNNETRIVYPGSSHNDEMCNIYIMFYTENAKQIMSTCGGSSFPELEKQIPADAKVKPAKNGEVDSDGASWSTPSSTDKNKKHEIKNRNLYFLAFFIFIAFITFLVSILVLIKRQKRRNDRSGIIRFKQISNDSKLNSRSRTRFEWVKNWTLNRNRQINFAKLNQNDEDESDDGGETVRFNKVSETTVTHNLVTDSESEDVVMSLNR